MSSRYMRLRDFTFTYRAFISKLSQIAIVSALPLDKTLENRAMFLQQCDYEYIDKRMAHVNALSRCNSILVLVGNIFEQVLYAIKQEDQDTEICKIRNRLKKGEDKLYELRDGLVPYIGKSIKISCYFMCRK